MTKARKRRPGGGRKPAGDIHGKIETFSTRISRETRQALDDEARRSGQSVSQVAERLLILGLKTKRDREKDDPMRALSFLIDQLAITVSAYPAGGAALNWRTNPFIFKSLRLAIYGLMKRLAPPGEIRAPAPSAQLASISSLPFTSPRDRAALAVELLWMNFQSAAPPFPLDDVFAEVPTKFRIAAESSDLRLLQCPRRPRYERGDFEMRGHLRERSPGHWAIVLDVRERDRRAQAPLALVQGHEAGGAEGMRSADYRDRARHRRRTVPQDRGGLPRTVDRAHAGPSLAAVARAI